MSKAILTELQTRVSDLAGALAAIGRIVSDNSVTPKRRLERINGVLFMYVEPAAAPRPTDEPAVKP